jgi:hypothetical protein
LHKQYQICGKIWNVESIGEGDGRLIDKLDYCRSFARCSKLATLVPRASVYFPLCWLGELEEIEVVEHVFARARVQNYGVSIMELVLHEVCKVVGCCINVLIGGGDVASGFGLLGVASILGLVAEMRMNRPAFALCMRL